MRDISQKPRDFPQGWDLKLADFTDRVIEAKRG